MIHDIFTGINKMRVAYKSIIQFVLAIILAQSFLLSETNATERRGWPVYHGSADNIHYSSLTQINRDNVRNLQVAWTLDTKDSHENSEMETNPIVVDGVIFVVSPKLNVIAA